MTENKRVQPDRSPGSGLLAGASTRRDVLKAAGAVGAGVLGAGFLSACGAGGSTGASSGSAGGGSEQLASELNVLCWEGYTDPTFTKPFEKKTGVKINSTFIGSNDELIAKLRGAPGQYDLCTPSCDTTNLLIEAEQVQPIDLSKVPNAKTAFPFFLHAPNVNVEGNLYGIPMAWGFIPLIYDTERIKTPPDSWNALWEPQYEEEVSVWQDISLLWTTGLLLGFEDVYNLTDAQLEQVKQKLIEQKPNIRKYWTTAGELTNLFANREIVIGMSYGGLTATQLREQGREVEEVIPKEGATSWFDNWMILKSSEKVSTAEAWLDHIQAPDTQKQIGTVTGYGITNTKAVPMMSKVYADSYHLDDPNFIAKLDYWKQTPRRQEYIDILNAVVAA